MAAKNFGRVPAPGTLTDSDASLLATSRAAFATVGGELERSRQKAAIGTAMRLVTEANRYLSGQAPWSLLKTGDPSDNERAATVLHTALQVVSDCTTLLAPFLPFSSQRAYEMLGGSGTLAPTPDLVEAAALLKALA